MRTMTFCLAGLLWFAAAAPGQAGRPVPPGVQEADKLPEPANVPPQLKPGAQQGPESVAEMRRDADELAKLAQAIPAEIEEVAKGQLPKDLSARLKRIEKLSKSLRRKIVR